MEKNKINIKSVLLPSRNALIYLWLLVVVFVCSISTLQLMAAFDLRKKMAYLPVFADNDNTKSNISNEPQSNLEENQNPALFRNIKLRNIAYVLGEKNVK